MIIDQWGKGREVLAAFFMSGAADASVLRYRADPQARKRKSTFGGFGRWPTFTLEERCKAERGGIWHLLTSGNRILFLHKSKSKIGEFIEWPERKGLTPHPASVPSSVTSTQTRSASTIHRSGWVGNPKPLSLRRLLEKSFRNVDSLFRGLKPAQFKAPCGTTEVMP